MSVWPSIMATVSMPTPASTASVAHVWRRLVMLTHGSLWRLQNAFIRLAAWSGLRPASSEDLPLHIFFRRRRAYFGSHPLRCDFGVFGGQTTISPSITWHDGPSLTSPVFQLMSRLGFTAQASPRLEPSDDATSTRASRSWPQKPRCISTSSDASRVSGRCGALAGSST